MRTKTPKLVLAAILVALSIALSFAKLFDMPMGGSVTLGSMLPIMLLSLVCYGGNMAGKLVEWCMARGDSV